jgi:hypothetical protein
MKPTGKAIQTIFNIGCRIRHIFGQETSKIAQESPILTKEMAILARFYQP